MSKKNDTYPTNLSGKEGAGLSPKHLKEKKRLVREFKIVKMEGKKNRRLCGVRPGPSGTNSTPVFWDTT